MDISEIADSLPSGFHDAELLGLNVDYLRRTASLAMNISIGDPDAPTEVERERTRSALVELSEVAYLAIELPDANYPFERAPFLRTDLVFPDDSELAASLEGVSSFRVFVNEWNSFIRVAARRVSLRWLDTLTREV